MEDLSMFDNLEISSKLKNYTVSFIIDAWDHIRNNADSHWVFAVDTNIYVLNKEVFDALEKEYRIVLLECNELNKSMDYVQDVIARLLDKKIRRNDVLIAIGGGITQDIVAFTSSILFRGIEWSFYPTTLLAQADSCIGSKSSINFGSYKNLLGTFIPPSKIFISPVFLETLSDNDIRSGIGEMLHYFLNDGMEDAVSLMQQYEQLHTTRTSLIPFIKKSLSLKKKIIEMDEFDTSIRHIFNYGHTFGHAIEAITDYAVSHGQSVTFGMDIANFISWRRGMISEACYQEMHDVLKKNIPVFSLNSNNLDSYLQALSKDKKNVGKQLGCILTDGPGKMKKVFLDFDDNFRGLLLEHSSLLLKQS